MVARRLLRALRDSRYALATGASITTLQDDCRAGIVQAVDEAWPRRFRLNELEEISRHLVSDSLFATSRLPMLDSSFDEVMTRDVFSIHYREEQIDAFAQFASELDPIILVGWHLAGWIDVHPCPGERLVAGIVEQLGPMFAPLSVKGGAVADNHVHLGGVSAGDFVLARHLLDSSAREVPAFRQRMLRLRSLLAIFLEYPEDDAQLASTITNLRHACMEEIELSPHRAVNWWIVYEASANANVSVADWLRRHAARAMMDGEIARAWPLTLS